MNLKQNKIKDFLKNFELWYIIPFLTGVAAYGMVYVSLPLAIQADGHNPGAISIVMAILPIAALISPLIGKYADKYHAHRFFYVLGPLLIGIGTLGIYFAVFLVTFFIFTLIIGLGLACVMTINPVFILAAGFPKPEVPQRLTAMSSTIRIGEMTGLIIASLLFAIGIPYDNIILIAGLFTFGTFVICYFISKKPVNRLKLDISVEEKVKDETTKKANLKVIFISTFGLVIFTFLLLNLGNLVLRNQYPIFMEQVYGINPSISSIALSMGVLVSVFMFFIAGRLASKRGDVQIIRIGALIRVISALGLVLLAYVFIGPAGYLALFFYPLMNVAMPFIESGSQLAAGRTSPVGASTAQGAVFASTAIAGVMGPLITGLFVQAVSYTFLTILALIIIGAGFLLAILVLKKEKDNSK